MKFLTHNDLWWVALHGGFQPWVIHMPCDTSFDWPDGPLDAPVEKEF